MKYSAFLLFIITYPVSVFSQGIGEWKAYPSQRTVNDLLIDEAGSIWAATTGGVFHYQQSGKSNQLTKIDGLSGQDVLEIIEDDYNGRIFVGYKNGRIDYIDVDTYEIATLDDISRATNFSSRGINDLKVNNQNIYAATDFGIVVIDLSGLFVESTFIKLGEINRATSVTDISFSDDTLFAATDRGVAFGDVNTNLALEENWVSFNEENGFVTDRFIAIEKLNDKIYASTASDNFVYDGSVWQVNDDIKENIIQYEVYPNSTLIGVTTKNIYVYSDSDTFQVKNLGSEIATSLSSTVDSEGNIYFGTLNEGAGLLNPDSFSISYITPDGPYQNLFSSMLVSDGVLIASSSQNTSRDINIDNGKGYYLFKDGEWQNFNKETTTQLRINDFRLAFTAIESDDYYYFGSWGHGVARHNKDDGEIRVFNETNSTLRGWEDDNPNYPVISGLGVDVNDDIWLVSRFGSTPLYYQKAGDEDWVGSPKYSVASNDEYYGLFIDSYGQKWITLQNTSAAGRGILVLNTNNPEESSDDVGVKLTNNPNSGKLPDQQVKAIIEDHNGEVWVGTQRGIARFIFPELLIDGGPSERRAEWLINEDTTATSRYLLRDANVTTMAVNGANEKWIGTENQGIFVVNAEGSRIIKRFTSENSPLFSNNIYSITVDDISGEVFIATDMGLLSYLDIPQGSRMSMKTLKVYPNPFNYSNHSQIVIEGLTEETVVKIIGMDGNVVHELNARGGRVSWNGYNYMGKQLGSGVYFVIAYEPDGKERGRGKVVIIR